MWWWIGGYVAVMLSALFGLGYGHHREGGDAEVDKNIGFICFVSVFWPFTAVIVVLMGAVFLGTKLSERQSNAATNKDP